MEKKKKKYKSAYYDIFRAIQYMILSNISQLFQFRKFQ